MTFWQWFGIAVIVVLCVVLPWLVWREQNRPNGEDELRRKIDRALRRPKK